MRGAHKGFFVYLVFISVLFLIAGTSYSQTCPSPARVFEDGSDHASIQEAYTYASSIWSGFTLQLVNETITEDVVLDGGSVLLDGGYECDFQSKTSVTNVLGSITISGTGSAIFADIRILSSTTCEFVDLDGDGYSGTDSCGISAEDCNDNNASINPGAFDTPGDGVDQDCSGADQNFSAVINECSDCHPMWSSTIYNAHSNFPTPNSTCNDCHSVAVSNIIVGHDGHRVRTAGNNMIVGSTIDCFSCHDYHDPNEYESFGPGIVWTKVWNNTPLNCDSCHDGDGDSNKSRASLHATATAHNNRIINSSCGSCHTSDTTNLGSPGTGSLATASDVDTLHRSDCTLCHNYTGIQVNPAVVRQAIKNGMNGTQISCTNCHTDKETGHGSVDHVATGYVTLLADPCGNCHDPGAAANATVTVTHNNTCSLCHTTVPNLQPGIPADGGDCNSCHVSYFPNHTHHNGASNDVSYDPAVDTSYYPPQGCANCHHDYDNVNGTSLGLSIWDTILVEHDLDGTKDGSPNTCDTCHASTRAAVELAISSGNPATCATCHPDKVPNVGHGEPTTGKHSEHLANNGDCATCHGSIPLFKDGHDLNGTNVCYDCHQDGTGNPVTVDIIKAGWYDPDFTLGCGDCHGVPPVTASHNTHLELTGCSSCHNPDEHLTGYIDVYETSPGDLGYPYLKEIGSPYESCSSSYCHSTVQGVTDPTDPPTYVASPAWGTPFGGTVETCTGCHGSGGHVGDAGTPLTTGSHAKHLDFRFDQDATCNACHFDWSYTGCVTCHQRQVNHVDNNIDVMFKPNFPLSAASSSGSYTGDPAPRTPYGSCSALYCHSPGTKASAPYDDPNVTAITWGGSGMPSDCTGCLYGDSAASQSMATGSHGTHIANYDCAECHARTVDNSRSLNSTINTPKNYTWGQRYHVDGWITVAFSSDIATNGTYAGSASPTSYRAPGSAAGACTNIYCHSNGSSVATTVIPDNTTPDWGSGSLACDSCHAYGPDYANGSPKANSHSAHNGYSCDTCHYSTTATGDTITNAANHANQVYDVQAGTVVTFTYSFDSNGGSCASISCHSGNSAVWGIPLVGGCSACHGNPPDYPNGSPKINSHSKHNDYNYSCAECHYATTNDGLTITDRSLHANGVMDVTFSDPSMNYNPGSHTCSNTYCHSNGMAVEGLTPESTSVQTPAPIYERTIQPNTSPAWGGGPLSCISCHDVMDEQDIYPNVIAGGPGYPDSYPDLQYKATSHGRHQFLGCNGCHYNTTNDGSTISDTASHVNGVYDLVPDPSLVASIGYAYDAGGGSCAAQCHTSNYHQGNTWRWGYNTLGASGSGYYVGSSQQVTKNLLRSSAYGEIEGPYAFYIDWGDGTSETVMSNGAWQQGSWSWHQYETTGSKTMKIWIRDSRNHLSLQPATSTFSLKGLCPSGDDPGVTYDNTRVVPDHDYEINGSTVTITDLSVDPDYFCNRPSNYAGDFGLVTIDWGDGTVETFEVRLTQDPNEDQVPWGKTKVFSHTYSAPFSGIINYGVEDNVHYYGGNSYPPMPMNIPDVNVPQ